MGYPKLAVQGKSQMDDKCGTPMTQEIPISVKLSLRSPQPYRPGRQQLPQLRGAEIAVVLLGEEHVFLATDRVTAIWGFPSMG